MSDDKQHKNDIYGDVKNAATAVADAPAIPAATVVLLRDTDDDIEVLMLTGHATVAGGIEAMKQGASDFLQKPVEIEELLKKINKARQSHLAVVHQKADAAMQEILKRKSW